MSCDCSPKVGSINPPACLGLEEFQHSQTPISPLGFILKFILSFTIAVINQVFFSISQCRFVHTPFKYVDIKLGAESWLGSFPHHKFYVTMTCVVKDNVIMCVFRNDISVVFFQELVGVIVQKRMTDKVGEQKQY